MRMCRYFSFDVQKILKTNSLCKLWNNIEFKACIFALDYIYIYTNLYYGIIRMGII